MTNERDIPASKEDIRLMMEQMGSYFEETEQRIDGLQEAMIQWKDEIIHEFQVIAEGLRHDMIGTHKDKIENHEDRLVRLERHAGLRAASTQ